MGQPGVAQTGREVGNARSELVAAGDPRRVAGPGWLEFINTEVEILSSFDLLKLVEDQRFESKDAT